MLIDILSAHLLLVVIIRLALSRISLSESDTYLEVWSRGNSFSNADFPNESLE